tara:strand:+ start:78744 stop:79052 length:309 start_codon:yes stop_codon:yes gene_type:complete
MSKSDTLLTGQPPQEESSYETTIYVSEDVFNKLMRMDYSGFVSIAGEKFLSLGGMRFQENKNLANNTILTPNPEEVKRLQDEGYKEMVEDLKVFGELYGGRL